MNRRYCTFNHPLSSLQGYLIYFPSCKACGATNLQVCFSCHQCEYDICSQCYNTPYINYSHGIGTFHDIPVNLILKESLPHQSLSVNLDYIENSIFHQPPSQYFKIML